MNTHKFDVKDAEKYGIYKAILLEHLKFHQQANEGNPDLTFDGNPYAFIKKETIENMYSYMNYDSVRKWLKELEDDGVIESCKPYAKSGYHLKYYHVKSIGIKSQSSETESQSMNETTSHSSILPSEEPNEGGIVSSVKKCNSKKELLQVWMKYRKSKGRFMNLYEQDATLNGSWRDMDIRKIKESILYTIENGWISLQEKEENKSDDSFNPENAKKFRNAFK